MLDYPINAATVLPLAAVLLSDLFSEFVDEVDFSLYGTEAVAPLGPSVFVFVFNPLACSKCRRAAH